MLMPAHHRETLNTLMILQEKFEFPDEENVKIASVKLILFLFRCGCGGVFCFVWGSVFLVWSSDTPLSDFCCFLLLFCLLFVCF